MADPAAAFFEAAVEAVVAGDEPALATLLRKHPELATASSPREHRANLLHYVAANGVEDERQRTPPNAVSIARLLVAAGADPNATAEFYGSGPGSTALVALVSSGHPHEAGLQEELVRVFCSAPGALPDGLDGDGYPMATAFTFFYPRAAVALADCGASLEPVPHAAGVGRVDLVESWLDPDGALRPEHGPYVGCYDFRLEDPDDILELALVYAAMGGHLDVVRLLDASGGDLSGGPHSNETALHTAALKGELEVVRYLIENGANAGERDERWGGTPLGWASTSGQREIVEYLADHTMLDECDAASTGRLTVLIELLEGQDPNAAYGGGDPGVLLRIAAHDGRTEVVRWLLENGADPDLANRDGQKAMDHAIAAGHDEIAKLLKAADRSGRRGGDR